MTAWCSHQIDAHPFDLQFSLSNLQSLSVNLSALSTLLDYHYWAKDRLLDALEPLTQEQFTRDLGNSFRSIRDTAAHLYSAEVTWVSRWNGHSPTSHVPADSFPHVATLRHAWHEHEAKARAFLAGRDEDNIHDVLEYKTFAGETTSSVYWHMIQHVVNHATYHRGQITTMLRQLGAAPPKSMDLIAFYRERPA